MTLSPSQPTTNLPINHPPPLPISLAPTLYEDGAWLDAATTAKLGERLTLCLNEDRHSPLTLAAVYPFRCGTQTMMARQIREANRKDKSKNDDIANRKKVGLRGVVLTLSQLFTLSRQ